MMHIELFPAEKTCEQGCSTCPLARKERSVTQTVIDQKVQKSFSLLENALKSTEALYAMHFATNVFEMFPSINHPELMEMARFETKNDVDLGANAEIFSAGIQGILKRYALSPRSLAFSIVPKQPLISETDIISIRNVLNELVYWFFSSRDKEIEITIRSNLISQSLFKLISNQLVAIDEAYGKSFLKTYIGSEVQTLNPIWHETSYYKAYQSEYVAECDSRKVILRNRIITPKQVVATSKLYVQQAEDFYAIAKNDPDILLSPKGVMLMHSSVAINNPVMWMSHGDFRKNLAIFLGKPNFSINDFIREILLENVVMYQWILKNKRDDAVINNNHFLDYFEELRPKTRQKSSTLT